MLLTTRRERVAATFRLRKEKKTVVPKRRLKPAPTKITSLLNDTEFTEYLRKLKLFIL